MRLTNQKTCCGDVAGELRALRPGESTEVNVTLRLADKFGGVEHTTAVETDLASEPEILLRTTATAFSAFRCEEAATDNGTLQVGSTRRFAYRAVATGVPDDPPGNLDHLKLTSDSAVAWTGNAEAVPAPDGVIVQTRLFSLTPPADDPPGEYRAEILLRDAGRVVFRATLNWQVVAAIATSPRMIVVKPGTTSQRVMVFARDGQPFSITRVECSLPGVEYHVVNPTSANRHIVEVKTGSPLSETHGSVTIGTDHAAQGRVELSLLVLE